MKYFFIILFSLVFYSNLVFSANCLKNFDLSQLQSGDIIFEKSSSSQSAAVSEATNSKWGHVGIIFWYNSQWMVAEAFGEVRLVPLCRFVSRNSSGFTKKPIAIKRMSHGFTNQELKKLAKVFRSQFLGIPYDSLFQWNDKRGSRDKAIYCSELVYKLISHVRSEPQIPGDIEHFRDMNWGKEVQLLAEKRYSKPWKQVLNEYGDEPIVSPVSMFLDPILDQKIYCHGGLIPGSCWQR